MTKKLKKRTVALIIILVIVLTWGIIAILPRSGYKADNMFRVDKGVMLIAHRGGRQEAPENTLEAFYNSYNIDNNVMMETDVSITSDGHIVLCHDALLDRTTNLRGLVSSYTYAYLLEHADFGYANTPIKDSKGEYVLNEQGNPTYTLSKYKTGTLAPIPNQEIKPTDIKYPQGIEARHESKYLVTTLQDLLDAFPNNLINVEIKQEGELGKRALEKVLEILEENDAFGRVGIGSFHKEIYAYEKEIVKERYPNLIFSPETSGVAGLLVTSWFLVDSLCVTPYAILQVPMKQGPIDIATRHFVATAHKHNIAVQFWTINDTADMRYLIGIDADGIMTDYPSLLKSVIEEQLS